MLPEEVVQFLANLPIAKRTIHCALVLLHENLLALAKIGCPLRDDILIRVSTARVSLGVHLGKLTCDVRVVDFKRYSVALPRTLNHMQLSR